MTLPDVDAVLRIVQVVLLPVVGWVAKLLLNLRKEYAALEGRVSKIETCMDNTPSGAALHELSLSIAGLRGDLKVATEKIGGLGQVVNRVEQVVARHEDFLLNGGPK